MEERRQELGRRIAAARLETRWKQKQLAAAVNVEPMTVSRWERGQHAPDLDMIDRLADALDKPFGYFIPPPPAEADRLVRIEAELEGLRDDVARLLILLQRRRQGRAPTRSAGSEPA